MIDINNLRVKETMHKLRSPHPEKKSASLFLTEPEERTVNCKHRLQKKPGIAIVKKDHKKTLSARLRHYDILKQRQKTKESFRDSLTVQGDPYHKTEQVQRQYTNCLLYTSPSPRDS